MKEISIIDQAKQLINSNEKAFEAVLPKNFDVKKFMGTFWLEVQKNPKLAECTNLIQVAKDVANFGLVIGGLANQAYLIPFTKKSQKGNQWTSETTAQLIIGYRGYITKLEEAGYSVEAEIVTKEEVEKGRFEEKRGSETKIIHSPIRSGIRGREDIALAYCVIKSKDNPPIISVLSKEEIEEMAKTEKWVESNGKKSKEVGLGNVWTQNKRATDFGQMCIKTAIRNAVKRVNLSIANEMAAYEGQRDQELESIKDITPSKTAQAHAAVEAVFEEQQPSQEAPAIEQETSIESNLISAINSLTSVAAIDKFLEKNSDYKAMEESDPEAFANIFEAAENRKSVIQMGAK